jgi:aminotransferase
MIAETALGAAVARRAQVLAPGLRNRMFGAARGLSGLIQLGRGDPDFDTPGHIIQAAQAALEEGFTHYTPWNGTPELRAAIARKLARENGLTADPETEIVVTNGAQEAVFLALQVLLDPGDEVLMPDPHYTAYDGGVELAGGVVVPVPTAEADGFELRLDVLERSLTPRSKVLVLVSPNNPAGNVLPRRLLEGLADLVKRHNLLVISDEVYEKFVYDGSQPISFATLPDMRERTITINSLSKTYAMTGWRLGYLAAPADFVRTLSELKYVVSICAPAATQRAAIAALDGPQDHIREMVRVFGERRQFMLSALDEMGFTYGNPQGGFTVLANITSSGLSSVDFALHMLHEAKVQIFPGNMYGPNGEGYERIAWLVPLAVLQEGMARMKAALPRR